MTTVCFLTALYAAAQRVIFRDGFCLPFDRRKNIVSLVLFTCNSIGVNFWHDILLIYSALAPEDTWTEAAHAWVFFSSQEG